MLIRAVTSHTFTYICVLLCLPVCSDLASRLFFFQAEDGIRYLVRSRGLGDVYKRQYLLFDFPAGALIVHLGMTGTLRFMPMAPPPALHDLSLIHI